MTLYYNDIGAVSWQNQNDLVFLCALLWDLHAMTENLLFFMDFIKVSIFIDAYLSSIIYLSLIIYL